MKTKIEVEKTYKEEEKKEEEEEEDGDVFYVSSADEADIDQKEDRKMQGIQVWAALSEFRFVVSEPRIDMLIKVDEPPQSFFSFDYLNTMNISLRYDGLWCCPSNTCHISQHIRSKFTNKLKNRSSIV